MSTYFQGQLLVTYSKWYWLRIFSPFKRNADIVTISLEPVVFLFACALTSAQSPSPGGCPLQMEVCHVCHSNTFPFRLFAPSVWYLKENPVLKSCIKVISVCVHSCFVDLFSLWARTDFWKVVNSSTEPFLKGQT